MIKNKYNKGLLIALAIGDGSIVFQKNSYKLSIEHCARQFNYLDHKKKLLENIFTNKKINLHKRVRTDKRTNRTQTSFMVVKCHPYFKILRRFIYKNGKKTYTKNLLSWLTPQGLAIWYQDDGFLNGNISSLATYCDEQEANIIIEFFKEKYNLEIRKYFHKGNQAYYHAFDVNNSYKFIDLIKEYIIPDMQYKIPGSYTTRVLDT